MAAGDMQQKNVTAAEAVAANAENPLTAVFLEPTDTKKQTADNYAAGFSPVNLALTKLRQLVAGLHGAVLGDYPGAVTKKLKTLLVSKTDPGGAYAMDPGCAYIEGNWPTFVNASLRINEGPVEMGNGGITMERGGYLVLFRTSAGENALLEPHRVSFTNTAAGPAGSNPPQTTIMRNELRACHIPKVSCTIRMSAPGVIDFYHGFGVYNVTISASQFLVTFVTPFADVHYTFNPGPHIHSGATNYWVMDTITSRTTTTCLIGVQSLGGGFLDPATTALDGIQFTIFGKQNG